MKKIFAIVLAVVLLMGLAACGAKVEPETTAATTEAPTTEAPTETTEPETVPETEAPKPGAGIRVEPYLAEEDGSQMSVADISYVDDRTVNVIVYKNYLYPVEEMESVDVGSILVINGEDVEVTSLAWNESTMIVNDIYHFNQEMTIDPMTFETGLGDYSGWSTENGMSIQGVFYSNDIPLASGFHWDNVKAYDGSNTVSSGASTFMEELKANDNLLDASRATVLVVNDALSYVVLFPAM